MTVISDVKARAYTIPTEEEESDGTLKWSSTTMVVVQVRAGGRCGLGWSYSSSAVVDVIRETLAPQVVNGDPEQTRKLWSAMVAAVRNIGRPGLVSSAIAAVDNALWDLKAKLHDVSLYRLLGAAREGVSVYASGGFTSYSSEELVKRAGQWAQAGFSKVKMKVGRHPEKDRQRVRAVRDALGPDVRLMVDANGAYDRQQALRLAHSFSQEADVRWFEEPVSSDDLDGLRLLRDRGPVGMEITAGEYGTRASYFLRMLQAKAVDVLQVDVTRCAGVTEFLRMGGLCLAFKIPLSAHTAPTLHLHLCTTLQAARDVEWFHDHVLIERRFLDGFREAEDGWVFPDPERPGFGVELRTQDLEPYRTR